MKDRSPALIAGRTYRRLAQRIAPWIADNHWAGDGKNSCLRGVWTVQISDDNANQVRILAVQGRLDSSNAGNLEAALVPLFSSESAVVLDLEQLEYVSSAGLRVFLMAAKRSKASGIPFALAGIQPSVRTVFEISGFLSIFNVYDSRPEAVAALS